MKLVEIEDESLGLESDLEKRSVGKGEQQFDIDEIKFVEKKNLEDKTPK